MNEPDLRIEGKLRVFEGLNHENYLTSVSTHDENLFLRLPGAALCYARPGEIRRSMEREATTLERLQGKLGAFDTPRCLAFEASAPELGGEPALLMTACPGMPLSELKKPGMGEEKCRVLGELLANIHQQPVDRFDHLPRYENSSAHLQARVLELRRADIPSDASRLLRDALEETGPAVAVVQGDTLPQNVIYAPPFLDPEARHAIVDWEFAQLGDPAYDFSILFRGNRRVFQHPGSRELILETYRAAGGPRLSPRRIAAYETVLLLEGMHEDGADREGLVNQMKRLCRESTSRGRD